MKILKNGEIEFFRFIFCLVIMLYHFSLEFDNVHIFVNGAIGVEFFFVLSGFLFAKSIKNIIIDKNTIPNQTYLFLKNKINHFIYII